MSEAKQTKYIFVTGGVLSGIGKGITAASIGAIMQAKGYTVNILKLDPYINVDAGTLNPKEHGEVYVTTDGKETDMDLGHYERFLNTDLSSTSSIMSGQVYSEVIAEERAGKYLGQTVQVIPHITNKIQDKIKLAGKGYQICLVELGGTIGDYESMAFVEAIRQFRRKIGSTNFSLVHLVYIPYLHTSKELKTKPAQNSIKDLRNVGLHADIIAARSDVPIDKGVKEKISIFADIEVDSIIGLEDVQSVYSIPAKINDYKICGLLEDLHQLPRKKVDLSQWTSFNKHEQHLTKEVTIGIIAKYLDHEDTYKSIMEALYFAGVHKETKVGTRWIDSEKIKTAKSAQTALKEVDGVVVPGGFGSRGIAGMLIAVKYIREKDIPILGICLGMQLMVVEYAFNVLGIENASSAEFNDSENNIFDLLPDQHKKQIGGTMRLGQYDCKIDKDSLAYKLYGKTDIVERHRHRYEMNPRYIGHFKDQELAITGVNPKTSLVEIIENKKNKFAIGVQFHPELESKPFTSHPLFDGLIKATIR